MSDNVFDYQPEEFYEYALDSQTPRLRKSTDLVLPPRPSWIGAGWIPRQEITVVVGEEGIGKSLTWVLIAAHVTNGREFPPFGIPAREPQDVIVIVTEDSALEVTTRLQVAGADLDRVHFFSIDQDGSGSPEFGNSIHYENFANLADQVKAMEQQPALIVVDAWLDTVSGNLNIRDTQQARAALHPWKQFSAKFDLATILVTHTNRQDTTSTRDLMGGTAALRQKARMVLFCARPHVLETERQELFIGPDKSNTTGLVPAVRFHVSPQQVREPTIDDPGTTAMLADPSTATATIRELLGQWKQQEIMANRQPTKAETAEDDLRSFMEGKDEVLTRDLEDYLRDAGHAKTAIEQAKKAAGQSVPGGKGGKWVFKLRDSSVPSLTSVTNSLTDGEPLVTPDSKSHYPSPMSSETSESSETSDTWEPEPALEWGVNPHRKEQAS